MFNFVYIEETYIYDKCRLFNLMFNTLWWKIKCVKKFHKNILISCIMHTFHWYLHSFPFNICRSMFLTHVFSYNVYPDYTWSPSSQPNSSHYICRLFCHIFQGFYKSGCISPHSYIHKNPQNTLSKPKDFNKLTAF